jgi:MFS transporter, ACS family, glucarate transporter
VKYRHRVLTLLWCLSIITFIDRVCISVAGKTIQEDLGLSLEQWGWVLGAFVLSYGAFEIPSGALGDRFGPRLTLTRIVTWWSLFTGLTGWVRSFWQLLAVRFLFGAGEAGAFPNSSVAISRWFPLVERARAQGIVWMGSRLGGALAPILVIPIQQAYGWRMSFYVFGVIGLIWAVVWYGWFRDHPGAKRCIPPGELLEINATPEGRGKGSLPWRTVLRQPNLWWIMLMYHSNAWCGFFFLTWLHTFLQNGRGYTSQNLMAFSWLPFVLGAIANVAGGLASDALVTRIGLKWGRRWIGTSAYAVTSLMILATIYTDDKFLTILFLALGYSISDFALPVAWAVCLDVGQAHAGAVTGAMNMAGQMGSFLTTVLFGYLVNAFGTYNAPLVPIAIMSAVASVAWLKIDASKPLFAEGRCPEAD